MNRLFAMSRAEMWHRAQQQTASRYDYFRSRRGYDFSTELNAPPNNSTPQFFFAPNEVNTLCEELQSRLPDQVDNILHHADKVCQHRFDLLGYRDVQYGDAIDWHLDAVHNKQAPQKPFYKIRYLDFDEVGDSKITWELNRHQHFGLLAKAYLVSGEEKYINELLRQWQHWQASNPYPMGTNWASSLEVAFRSLSWCWVYHLLAGSEVLPPDFRTQWLQAQALNGRHIETYLSTFFSPNTHLLGEAVALFFIGTLCPEIRDAEHWKARGWEIVLREAAAQVQKDGFHFEQSTYYHVYALDLFLHAALLAQKNGVQIPEALESTIVGMLQALFLMGRNGSPCSLGDDDGGRVFDGRRNQSQHLLDPLAIGAVLFHRGDFKYAVGDLTEESVWLLGKTGLAEWDRIEAQRPSLISAELSSAGIYMLTIPSAATQLTIDAGPQGAHTAGHGHADALSICLQSHGRSLLIDPGTSEYVGPGVGRQVFRTTASHSTLRVDDASQSTPAGPFSWQQLTRTSVDRWIQGHSFDLFAGSHDGYAQLPAGVTHRRWVIGLKMTGMFLVRDVVEGKGKHRLDIPWHLGPELFVEDEHLFRLPETRRGLGILPMQGHRWTEDVRKEHWSPAYGRTQFATVLNFGIEASLPVEFVTALLPLEETNTPIGVLSRLADGESQSRTVQAYSYSIGELDHQFFFATSPGNWQWGPVQSDAEFLCRVVNRRRNHENELVILCHGSYAEFDGESLFHLNRAVTRCELVASDGRVQSFCSDPDALLRGPSVEAASQPEAAVEPV